VRGISYKYSRTIAQLTECSACGQKSSLMQIRLYAPLRSRAVKIYLPYKQSLSSIISRSKVLSLIIRAFNLL
jgi:hypothetical protein